MGTNTQNLYLFKALDAYPWELEKAVEALNYALSYEPENVKALSLMAKVHAEQLGDYATAITYYEKAMASTMELQYIYPEYIRTLLWSDDYEAAQKLIDYAFKVKGIDTAQIYLLQAQIHEAKEHFNEAIAALKQTKRHAFNGEFIVYVDQVYERVKKKRQAKSKRDLEKPVEKKEVVKATTKDKSWFKNRLNGLL